MAYLSLKILLIKNLNLSLHTDSVDAESQTTTFMSFNFGNATEFHPTQAGDGTLVTSAGQSALFDGEDDGSQALNFGDGQDDDDNHDEPNPLVPEQKKVGKGPKLPQAPAKSLIELDLDEGDEEEDDEEEKPAKNKKVKPIPTPDDLEEDENEGGEEENIIAEYAADMFKAGILTPMDGDEDLEFNSEEDLKERFLIEKQVGAQSMLSNFLSKYGPEHQKAFQEIFVNGVDPKTYYQKTAKIQNLESLKLDDASVQERLVKTYLAKQEWSEEDITERIEKLKTYDDLEREAKAAHKQLLKQEQEQIAADALANQARVQREAQKAQQYQYNLHQTLSKAITDKNLGGIPVNEQAGARVFGMMTQKVWELNGEKLTTLEKLAKDILDPANVELAAKIALLYDNKFDFAPIKKKAITEETSKLFNAVKRKSQTDRRGRTGKSITDNWV